MGLKVSVDFWTEDLTGPLPETARFFSKQRLPPQPGDTLFVNEGTTATRHPPQGSRQGAVPESVQVRVVGTLRVTGRFWSVPGEELTVNVRPVGDGEDVVQVVESSQKRATPWMKRD